MQRNQESPTLQKELKQQRIAESTPVGVSLPNDVSPEIMHASNIQSEQVILRNTDVYTYKIYMYKQLMKRGP